MEQNVWQEILTTLRAELPAEDFRRWFSETGYASDAGDLITVWVSTEGIRRHISGEYYRHLRRALRAIGRPDTHIRFVVAGFDEDDEKGKDADDDKAL